MVLKHGEWRGCRFANEIICIARNIADKIESRFKRSVHIIPNGVAVPEILTSEDALKKYGVEKGKYILAVGRFVPEKGFDDLLQAFIRSSNPFSGARRSLLAAREPEPGQPSFESQAPSDEPRTSWKLVHCWRRRP